MDWGYIEKDETCDDRWPGMARWYAGRLRYFWERGEIEQIFINIAAWILAFELVALALFFLV